MFDKSILETDNFLNVSLTAKALYFLLGMEADDEGFVAPKRVIRLYGGEMGDLQNLIDVGLIIPFKNGVVVITHWNQNNWLDKRRIKPTQYQEEKNLLLLTEQRKYLLSNGLASIEESRGEEYTPSPSASGASNPVYGENPTPQEAAIPPSQSTELSYESDEDMTPTSKLKKREAKKDGYKGDLVKPLRRWAEEKIGKKYPNIGKQEKFIGQMLYAGYTEGAIKETFENLLDDAFWGEKGFDFAQVANEISKAKKEVAVPWHLRPSK